VLELEDVEELVLDEDVEVVDGLEVLVEVEEELVEVVVGWLVEVLELEEVEDVEEVVLLLEEEVDVVGVGRVVDVDDEVLVLVEVVVG
jgi:hypothetical protein